MPTDRKPRIALEPHALRALRTWAAIEDKDPGGLVSNLILDHMPVRVRDALRENSPKPSEPPRVAAIDSCKPQRRKRLADNPDALERIKEMWNSGQKNQAEISRRIGYHRATVNDNIQRMLESGEITK